MTTVIPSDNDSGAGRPTGFLDLSAELRNKIYHLIIPNNTKISLMKRWKSFGVGRLTVIHDLDVVLRARDTARLLRTCHQVHSEASPIFYGSNHFEGAFQALDIFSRMIGGSIRLLRTVNLENNNRNKSLLKATISRLKNAKGLQTLKITYQRGRNQPPADVMAMQCRILVQALYKNGGNAEAAAQVVQFMMPPLPRPPKVDEGYEARLSRVIEKYTTEVREELMKYLK